MIEVGDKAPDFTAPAAGGEIVKLKQFLGKWVVLYFYPRDNTPGCTRQACAFRDAHEDFSGLDARVIGCSGDSEASHQGFIAKFGLPFVLISDPDHRVAEAYGVWQEKNLYGKKSMGIVRSTFIVNPNGEIAAEWRRVKVDGHIGKVLVKLRELQAGS
jgi:peroxiredoxin Q/BCP